LKRSTVCASRRGTLERAADLCVGISTDHIAGVQLFGELRVVIGFFARRLDASCTSAIVRR